MDLFGRPTTMGPLLQAEVERQLLEDLKEYGLDVTGWTFDWSDKLGEGHGTFYLDGYLENYSDVGLVDVNGKDVAGGWIEFIHFRGENDPLYVFWEYLRVRNKHDHWKDLKKKPGIPKHLWDRLPNDVRDQVVDFCDECERFFWCKDRWVTDWRQERRKRKG